MISQASHIQVGMGSMVTAGSLDGGMVSTLARNARDVGSTPALGTLFLIVVTATTELKLHSSIIN